MSPLQKTILLERYVNVVSTFEARCLRIALVFHTIRILITVGSLVVPALLSIQYVDTGTTSKITDTGSFAYRIYWATWVISLLVTTSNGVLSVFKIDKKYYFLHTTLEQLRSEGWQYLELSGRYSGFYTPQIKPSHDNQFVYFCHSVEKIKMRQVEEEYYKLSDANHQQTAHQVKTADGKTEPTTDKKMDVINSLMPPTPLNSILEQAKDLPPELFKQIFGNAVNGFTPPSPAQRKYQNELVEGAPPDGATVPTMPVSSELPTSPSPQKGSL